MKNTKYLRDFLKEHKDFKYSEVLHKDIDFNEFKNKSLSDKFCTLLQEPYNTYLNAYCDDKKLYFTIETIKLKRVGKSYFLKKGR